MKHLRVLQLLLTTTAANRPLPLELAKIHAEAILQCFCCIYNKWTQYDTHHQTFIATGRLMLLLSALPGFE